MLFLATVACYSRKVSAELTAKPKNDPTILYRCRDGLYAADMLIVGLVWLDLFSWLTKNPADAPAICRQFALKDRPADVMLTLFIASGYLKRQGDTFEVTELAREFLVSDSPWFLGPYYASLKERPVAKDLLDVLRTGKPANWASEKDKQDWHKSMELADFAAQFTAAMDCRGVYLARAIAERINLRSNHRLLDIAGGSGIYSCSLVTHFPNLRATVLEKPPVDAVARAAIAQRGLAGQVTVIASDMLAGPLPGGHDVHLYSNVLHDWDVPTVRALLKKSHEALVPGGLLIIHDAHLNEDKSGPLHVAEYSVLLMHATEGRCYSVAEMREYLREAGFGPVQFAETVVGRSVITAS